MTSNQPVFCGKCGTANPVDNDFCRRCGHRLAEDIVEPGDLPPEGALDLNEPPVPGVALERYPLVDPETGEAIDLGQEVGPRPPPQRPSPPKRNSVILKSLGLHFALLLTLLLLSMTVLSQLGMTPSTEAMLELQQRMTDLGQRREANQISDEQTETEVRQLFETAGLTRLATLLAGPLLLGFFLAGLIAGRLWQPRRLFDVALSGMIIGGLFCLISPLTLPLAVGLSLLGTLVGRKWGARKGS